MPKNSNKKVIGLTGGIGSGKTVIGLIFSNLGYPVFNSDDNGREQLTQNAEVVKNITDTFGTSFLDQDKLPDRKKLAQLVFSNPEALKKLNTIIHPAVNIAFQRWENNQQSTLVVRESALLFETGFFNESFKNILVTAPTEVRIKRVMQRNSISRNQVLERMKNQWDDDKKIPLADYIIINDDKTPVLPQIWKVVEDLKNNL